MQNLPSHTLLEFNITDEPKNGDRIILKEGGNNFDEMFVLDVTSTNSHQTICIMHSIYTFNGGHPEITSMDYRLNIEYTVQNKYISEIVRK